MIKNSSDESDGEVKILPRRPEQKKQSKNGALWKEMLEEENLMQDMKSCEVARNIRKRKIDRGAESYDYSQDDDPEKRPKYHREDDPSTSSLPQKKKYKKGNQQQQHHHFVDKSPKHLDDLNEFTESTDEQFVQDVARKLDEENLELIQKVLAAIGREECAFYYNKTKKMEGNGGLLTVNKQRRRTSGGVFLFLIKTSNKLTTEQKDLIFNSKKDSEG